ncbi:hypothetical protein BGZ93_003623 [Podila epicladia]|nr:hypothetical protein BGZ93_003623 [Podila epicladia]
MPVMQRMQGNNSDGSNHKLSIRSPLSHEIRLENKVPRASRIAVSGLARMKVKSRKTFAHQSCTDLMRVHQSKQRSPHDTNSLKVLQDQIEDLRDMFKNLWVSSPRICSWRMNSSSSSKTSKNSKHLRRTTRGGWLRHRGLAHSASRNRPRSPLTGRKLLASFIRTTSHRFQDQIMTRKRSSEYCFI